MDRAQGEGTGDDTDDSGGGGADDDSDDDAIGDAVADALAGDAADLASPRSLAELRLRRTVPAAAAASSSWSLSAAAGVGDLVQPASRGPSAAAPAPASAAVSVLPAAGWPDACSFLCTACAPAVAPLAPAEAAPTSLEGQQRLRGAAAGACRQDLPVTFRAKVKSSGYGAAPPRRPAWAKASAALAAKGASGAAGAEAMRIDLLSHLYAPAEDAGQLAADDGVFPREAESRSSSNASRGTGRASASASASGSRVAVPAASAQFMPCGAVSCVAFSSDGAALGVASHDGAAYSAALGLLRRPPSATLRVAASLQSVTRHVQQALPLSTSSSSSVLLASPFDEASTAFAPSPLTSASWSHATFAGLVPRPAQARPPRRGGAPRAAAAAAPTSHLFLSCGGDRSASVWVGASSRAEPLFVLRGPGPSASSGDGLFSAAVSGACFYFLDKFAVVTSGEKVFAFTWALDREAGALPSDASAAVEDVVRLRRRFASQARGRLAASCCVANPGGSITAVAAHNAFRSPLAFFACSDRSVRVLDMGAPGGAPAEVLRLPEAHQRAVHTLALPAASGFADVSPASLDCFLTASTDGLVRLWDLRANRCARQLSGGHTNRAHTCGAALSPDLTHVAVGSEDRCCCVYDLRTGGALAKLRGAGDATTSVAWHPLTPLLAVGSLDGGVRFYSPPW